MIADKLRKSILQAAIQGKLTEQLPEDGDARELLTKIKAEKVKLIAEGKIKKEKPLPEISDDEIPFDIPDNWCWVRLGTITDYGTGRQVNQNNITANSWILELEDIEKETYKLISKRFDRKPGSSKNAFIAGDILYGKLRPYLKKVIIADGSGFCSTEIIPFRGYGNIDSSYLKYCMVAPTIDNYINQITHGMDMPRLGTDKAKNLIIPLPPLAEQQRIVEAIEKAFEKIKDLEKDELKLNLLQKSFPKKMKDSLLQAAIQGKLTEQLPEDGDARELLTKIKAEKVKLIAEGKIKKEKPLPEISDDEIPFDIPESWCWVRLGEIITLKSGQDMTPDKYNSINKGIPYITGASNFVDGVLNIDRWTPVPRSIADEGDLLITCKGTVGDMAFLKHSSAHIARQVMAIKPLVGVDIRYIKIYLSFYVNELKSRAKSMIPGISREIILGSLLPLPPFDEQVRIVERLEQLLPLCDSLE